MGLGCECKEGREGDCDNMSEHKTKQQIQELQHIIELYIDNIGIRACFEEMKDILQDLCERVDEIEKAHEEDMDNTGSW